MARRNTAITLTEEDRKLIETWIAAHGTPQQVVLRCRIVLLKADGMDDLGIAQKLHINRHTCRLWRQRMLADGPSGLWEVAPGRGRKPRAGLAARLIEATLSTKPKGQTHWSSRGMAREQGVHHSTVARVWSEHEEFIESHNEHAKAFVWTATAEDILAKVERCRKRLEAISPGCTSRKKRKVA